MSTSTGSRTRTTWTSSRSTIRPFAAAQIRRLEKIRATRDPEQLETALAALRKAAETGEGNILGCAVEAARARATVGEISDCLRDVYGDHAATPKVVRNIFSGEYKDEPEYQTLVTRLSDLAASLGETPRIMVAKLGQDGHDRGAKVIASAFGDVGFEVIAGPLFQTPDEAAETAVAEKVHVVGMSSLAAGHKTLAPQLIEALKARGASDVIVVVGGVHPAPGLSVPEGCGRLGDFRSRLQRARRRPFGARPHRRPPPQRGVRQGGPPPSSCRPCARLGRRPPHSLSSLRRQGSSNLNAGVAHWRCLSHPTAATGSRSSASPKPG